MQSNDAQNRDSGEMCRTADVLEAHQTSSEGKDKGGADAHTHSHVVIRNC